MVQHHNCERPPATRNLRVHRLSPSSMNRLLLLMLSFAPLRTSSLSCADTGSLQASWDDGNCRIGARSYAWRRDPRTYHPIGGDLAMCNVTSDPPGKYTCEARLVARNAESILLEPAPSSSTRALVVFLPGTGATPAKYSRLLRAAQTAGNYVIGLTYLSQPVAVSAFNTWCGSDIEPRSEAACNARSHASMVFGTGDGPAGLWDVPASSSVTKFLKMKLESVDWGHHFLDRGDLKWERIVVSGHSQGAGHAAYLSSTRPVLGAALLSGPQDTAAGASLWLSRSENAGARRRILISAHEECGPSPIDRVSYCSENRLLRNAARMGIQQRNWRNWTLGMKTASLFEASGGGVVVSYAAPTSTCTVSRRYHCTTAFDTCAPDELDEVWVALFSDWDSGDSNYLLVVLGIFGAVIAAAACWLGWTKQGAFSEGCGICTDSKDDSPWEKTPGGISGSDLEAELIPSSNSASNFSSA